MCRLQVFTISGAWRRLYFAIRVLPPQTSAHTQVCAYLHVCMRVQIHVHFHRYTYTYISLQRKARQRKQQLSHTQVKHCQHIHTYTQTFTTSTLETMAEFLLYAAKLTQRDTHTYACRPNERARESATARPGHQLPYHVFAKEIRGGSCCCCCCRSLHLPAQRTRTERRCQTG